MADFYSDAERVRRRIALNNLIAQGLASAIEQPDGSTDVVLICPDHPDVQEWLQPLEAEGVVQPARIN